MGIRDFIPGGKAAGAWSWPLTPSSAEIKKCVELYLHSPNTPSLRGAQLKKHRDNFTFTFTTLWRRIWVEVVLKLAQDEGECQQEITTDIHWTEAGGVAEQVWKRRRREKNPCPCRKLRPFSPASSEASVLNEIPGSFWKKLKNVCTGYRSGDFWHKMNRIHSPKKECLSKNRTRYDKNKLLLSVCGCELGKSEEKKRKWYLGCNSLVRERLSL
jgi:hypothetical protein